MIVHQKFNKVEGSPFARPQPEGPYDIYKQEAQEAQEAQDFFQTQLSYKYE